MRRLSFDRRNARRRELARAAKYYAEARRFLDDTRRLRRLGFTEIAEDRLKVALSTRRLWNSARKTARLYLAPSPAEKKRLQAEARARVDALLADRVAAQ